MTTVKIVKDGVRGADDGATVRHYEKGKEYNVSDALAEVFIEAGEAEEVEVKKPTATEKAKAKAEAKAAAEKAAAEKAAAEKEAAEKATAEAAKSAPGLPPIPGK